MKTYDILLQQRDDDFGGNYHPNSAVVIVKEEGTLGWSVYLAETSVQRAIEVANAMNEQEKRNANHD